MPENPKKILLVVRWPVGGIRTFIRYVYKNIDTERWHLTILAPSSSGLETMREDLRESKVTFIAVNEMPTDGSSGAVLFTRHIYHALKTKKYDLVHSHGFISGACTSLAQICSFSNTPHLMTSHDIINKSQFHGIKGVIKKAVLAKLFNYIDKIHSVSNDAQNNFLEYFPSFKNSDKCLVIRNGIDVEQFSQVTPRNFRQELSLSEEEFLIGFFGRFMSQKGFILLIEAIECLCKKELPKKPLVLSFGDGGFSSQEKLEISKRKLNEYFLFLSFIPNVAESIKGLDVVVMPSLWEACPLTPMETLVCGIPLIATDCIGLREVIRNTPAHIIPSGNALALSEAILQEMKGKNIDYFMHFRNIAVTRYDVKNTKTSIFLTYDKLMKSKFE